MTPKRGLLTWYRFLAAGFFISFIATHSLAATGELDCLKCHASLVKEKVKHAAVDMGCSACHTGITANVGQDAKKNPHKSAGTAPKGLSSDQPDLCYGCHDKSIFSKKTIHAALSMGCTACHNPHSSKNAKLLKSEQPVLCYDCHDKGMFTKKTVHAAVGMGCTGCHSPHSSDNEKLLISAPPDLCFTCHDSAEFRKKNVHSPVAGGMCLTCHTPHSSDQVALLAKEPILVCLDCHGDVEKKPHAIKGSKGTGHPLGKKDKQDPKRPERKFYCGSCHNPHSSDSMKLFRYPAKATMGLCVNCHKF